MSSVVRRVRRRIEKPRRVLRALDTWHGVDGLLRAFGYQVPPPNLIDS